MSDEPLPTAPHTPAGVGTYLTIILRDGSDTEVLVAVRRLRKLGLDGHDIATAIEQRGKLLAIAKELKLENERLRQLARGTGPDPWTPAGSPQDQAAWVLQLYADKILGLSHFEEDFLLTISCIS